MVRATLADGRQEAMPASTQAPLLRHAVLPAPSRPAGPPYAAAVPSRAFADDVQRKVALRRVMGPRHDALQEAPVQPRFEKDDVNYRYASDDTRSCDECVRFRKNGSCELVAGLIRRVDTCDQWKGVNEPFGVFRGARQPLGPVQATLATDREGWDDDPWDSSPFDAGDCPIDEQDDHGRCPDDPSYSGPEDPFGDGWEAEKTRGGLVRARLAEARGVFAYFEAGRQRKRKKMMGSRGKIIAAEPRPSSGAPSGVSPRAFAAAKRRTSKDAGWVSSMPLAGPR